MLCACVLYSGLVKCPLIVSNPCEPIETPHLVTRWGVAARTNMGQIQEFCPDSESSTAYVERVELFFTANNIPAEKNDTRLSVHCWGYYVQVVA